MSELDWVRELSPADIPAARETTPTSASATRWLDGSSPAITQLRGQIRRVAPHFRTALLVGEPGCGEEAAARILHQLSPVRQRPFIALNPSEINSLFAENQPEDALASVGTFYLSRPDQLPRSAQTILLRLLRTYGSQAPRIVAYTERSLRPLVSAGSFSAELAEHLSALRVVLPPLRDRREDIPQLLARILHDLAKQSGLRLPELAPDLIDAAQLLPWHGNLPQLHSAAEGLLERSTRLILHAPDLDAVLGTIHPAASPDHRQARMIPLNDVIQEHLRAVLVACNGNKLRTAEILGISRSTLYRMLDLPAPSHPSKHLQMAG